MVTREFNNCFIIRLVSLFFNEYILEAKVICPFHVRVIAIRRKVGFHLCISRKFLQPNTDGPTLGMSRPLFERRYLQVMWWAFGERTGRKICIE